MVAALKQTSGTIKALIALRLPVESYYLTVAQRCKVVQFEMLKNRTLFSQLHPKSHMLRLQLHNCSLETKPSLLFVYHFVFLRKLSET